MYAQVQTYIKGSWYYAEYEPFRIDSEDKWYTIHLSGYSGNAGDSLTNTSTGVGYDVNHNGMNFTTYDSDNDNMIPDGSCAVKTKGSWWFNNCWYSLLTGQFATQYMSWYTLHDSGIQNNGRLRATRMMIRSI